ncbi:GtrA family protein [Candidatus Kaiserbacteria bacterium]|nr:GtrA family protein [Candidatus Kaiserbacteria bacterium]
MIANLLLLIKEVRARANALYPSPMRIIRFCISGGIATLVNLGTLFSLTHFFSVWYVFSSIIAFMLAFWVSFSMQKLWTFKDVSRDHVYAQALTFLTIVFVGLGINTTLIFVLVEYGGLHYLGAQLISGVFIAMMNYFSYKHLVFHDTHEGVMPSIGGAPKK